MAVVVFWMLLGHLGLPLPTIPLMLAVGALAGLGYFPVAQTVVAVFVASMAGDFILFSIGRARGKNFLRVFCRVTIDPSSCVRKANLLLLRFGAPFLVAGNFIPWVNSITAPLAGISGMRFPAFALFDGIGVFLWTLVYFFLGYYFGEKVEAHTASMLSAMRWVGVAFLAGVAIFVFWKILQRRRFLRQLALARITPDELKGMLDSGAEPVIVDLRDPHEFVLEPRTLPGAVSIPFEQLSKEETRIQADREIILICT